MKMSKFKKNGKNEWELFPQKLTVRLTSMVYTVILGFQLITLSYSNLPLSQTDILL